MAAKKAKHNKSIPPKTPKAVPVPEPIKPLRIWPIILGLLLIAGVGILTYSNSTHNPFLWDDGLYVRDNKRVQSLANIPNLFTQNITALNDNNFYRPLQMLTYVFNYHYYKLGVEAYHVTNISFHILVALGLFWLVLILSRNTFLSVVAALLFISHPIHLEAVTYISGRADSMAALFILLTIISYIYYTRHNKIYLLILSMISFVCGLLSKENAAIVPVLLLGYEYIYNQGKIRFLKLMPFVAIDSIYIALRKTVFNFTTSNYIDNNTSFFDRIPLIFDCLGRYIQKLLLPLDLHMEYPLNIPSFLTVGVLDGFVIGFLLIWLVFKFKQKDRLLSFVILWFLILYVPISNIFPLNAFFYEHWVYTPSIGLFVLVGWGASRLFNINLLTKFLVVLLLLGALTANVYLSLQQNFYWQNPEIFFKRILVYNPNSSRVNNELGLLYFNRGNWDESIAYFKKALEIDPNFYIATVNLTSAYSNKGMLSEAIETGERSTRLKGGSEFTHLNLGNTYVRNFNNDKAIAEFKKAIQIDPALHVAYNGMGVAYFQKGDMEKALESYNKAISIKPDYSDAFNNRASIHAQQGQHTKAIEDYNRAIELNPRYDMAYLNRSKSYYRLGRMDEAILSATKTLELDPANFVAHVVRGLAYNEQKKFDLAIQDYDKAIELNPKNFEVYYNRGLSYGELGNLGQAILDYSKAIELNPKDIVAYGNRGASYAAKYEYDKAVEDFSKVIEIDPKNADAYNNRATVYIRKAFYDEALVDLTKAIEIKPQQVNSYANRSIVYAQKKDFDHAWQDLKTAQSMGYKPDPTYVSSLEKASGKSQ